MFHDLAIITVTGELDLALCVELTRELNAALRSAAASDRHRPRGCLLGGLIGNRAAAQRHSVTRPHRTSTRDCLPDRIAAPRFQLTALDRQLPMYETRQGALAAVGAS